MSEVRAAYRTLLRAVKARIDRSPASSWTQEARQLFRSDQTAGPEQLQLARDYALLLHAVHDYKDLLTSYNIGIDRQSRQREDIAKSAARAGLSVPKHWDETAAYQELQARLKK